MALIRQEAKDNEIARLGKRKVIKNILKTMTDVMLLSSGQFLEDAVQQNKEEQIARLMSELIARNKANSVSIEQFKNK